ncbi:hypothetical protein CRENBAI_013683 [Crenichthys baileyi]|uniref:Uncharacterized protein n=1 Tax=Crenichthys baileyi TaxID=28760 RepID=A0AAV9RDC5_9TELE
MEDEEWTHLTRGNNENVIAQVDNASTGARMFQFSYIFGPNQKASGATMETRADMTDSGREKKSCQQGRLPLRLEVSWAAACYVALLALCAVCYSNSLQGEFVHDDVWAIVNNPDVRPGSSLRNIFSNDFWGKRMADNTSHKSYRPLCILTFK